MTLMSALSDTSRDFSYKKFCSNFYFIKLVTFVVETLLVLKDPNKETSRQDKTKNFLERVLTSPRLSKSFSSTGGGRRVLLPLSRLGPDVAEGLPGAPA